MSAGHSVLPPSGAAAWLACSLWVLMNQMHPESEAHKADSDEGIASHWAGSEMLHAVPVCVGQFAPNGIVLNDEMIDGAEMYVEAIDARLAALGVSRDVLHIEEPVDCEDINPLCWGTPDCWFYIPEQAALDIWDYKFGHRFVDAFENWQCLTYCAGILSKLGIGGLADQTLTVNIHVVQPRSYHRLGPVRTWSVKASELRGHFNKLRYAADMAMRPNAAATPNAACLDCVGRHTCDALQRDAYRSADISFASLPVDLPPAALGLELKFLREAFKRLEGRITGLEEQARREIMSGKLVSFFAMVPVQSAEKWKGTPADVATLGSLFGRDFTKRGVITPTQARAMLKKAGMPTDGIDAYAERGTGLALEFDDGTTARKVFGK